MGRLLCRLGIHTPGRECPERSHYCFFSYHCGRPGCKGFYEEDYTRR